MANFIFYKNTDLTYLLTPIAQEKQSELFDYLMSLQYNWAGWVAHVDTGWARRG